ncbi:serine/threonine-protein kinase [Nocardia miyunensis]|uniref:serine/threonine-protein kinase n=1 Tax=Nocardia miyunensis TaxID=282684 RepID=UPI00082FB42D|nr:serine/threonine-protein kinase [Nocardia miyunensis]
MSARAFGRYQLQELIGEGGMGQVWRAYDTVTDRIVAIKVLPEHCASDPNFRERFRREAHDTARLREPHVIPIHGYGEIDGRFYLDMRLIDGIDLRTLLKRDGAMQPKTAVAVIAQAASALDAAHEQGLVHRDVKPSNLLVNDSGFVYLIDFGICRSAEDPRLTRTSTMIGTLAYMAPERFTDDVVDGRSDVYALTCVLCECLTGTPPYPGTSAEQQIAAHLTAEPPAPSLRRSDLPGGFDHVVARGLAKSPDDRYSTAGELAVAAGTALADTPPTVPATPLPKPSEHRFLASLRSNRMQRTRLAQRRKRPVIRAMVVAVAVLIAAAAVAGLWRLSHGASPTVAFDGKYGVTYTHQTVNGKPVEAATDTRVWSVRSRCPPHSDRCVASITSENPSVPGSAPTQFVADYRDGAWMVTREVKPWPDNDCISPITHAPQMVQGWQQVALRSSGSQWTGTYRGYVGGPCVYAQESGMALSRLGNIDSKVHVAAPEDIPAPVDPPPTAMNGTYKVTITYSPTPEVPNPPAPEQFRQRYDTICLRTGDRCAATTLSDPSADPRADPRAVFAPMLVYAGGTWGIVYDTPYPCYNDSNEPHTTATIRWNLVRSDTSPDSADSFTGTWSRDKTAPCPATSHATVDMRPVGSIGLHPALAPTMPTTGPIQSP